MDHTLNYNLKKPLSTTNVRISDINENMDILDTKLKEVDNKVGNIDFSSLQTQIDKKADKEEVTAHLGDDMPHIFKIGTKPYKYGLKPNTAKDGLVFVYEEVL